MTQIIVHWSILFIMTQTMELPPLEQMWGQCQVQDPTAVLLVGDGVGEIDGVPEPFILVICVRQSRAQGASYTPVDGVPVQDPPEPAPIPIFTAYVVLAASHTPPTANQMMDMCRATAESRGISQFWLQSVEDVVLFGSMPRVVVKHVCGQGPPGVR